jgi:hypothetical protein
MSLRNVTSFRNATAAIAESLLNIICPVLPHSADLLTLEMGADLEVSVQHIAPSFAIQENTVMLLSERGDDDNESFHVS